MMDTRSWLIFIVLLIPLKGLTQSFYTGVDLSYINELEGCGAAYFDRTGTTSDPYELLKKEGAQTVRLRLWHNPSWTNYSNFEDVKVSIQRAKSAGMSVMLDFHYSDFWTDPGRQWRPEAWEDVADDSVLQDSVYNYTKKVLRELNDSGLLPDFVQVGNETNGNILIARNGTSIDQSNAPELYPVNWNRQVGLLQQGIDAVNDLNLALEVDMKTIIHIAGPEDAFFWFGDAIDNGLSDFDIIGLSYYPQWNDMGVREVGDQVARLKSQYNKEVMVVETGYPWTTNNGNDNANNVLGLGSRLFTYSNTFSIETQRDFLIELTWLVKENGGIGVIYWEPTWISSSCRSFWAEGSHWDNATLFDFEGKLHAGADFLSYDYDMMPDALQQHEVTFTVDMTTADAENGVYVAGDFTGMPWTLIPMTLTTNDLYEVEVSIPGRTSGGYTFYNNENLSDEYREEVPEQCAQISRVYREYRVRNENNTFYFAWGECDQQPDEQVVGINDNPQDVLVYPTTATNEIFVKSNEIISQVEMWDTFGRKVTARPSGKNGFKVGHLASGLYIMRFRTSSGIHESKFIKQ